MNALRTPFLSSGFIKVVVVGLLALFVCAQLLLLCQTPHVDESRHYVNGLASEGISRVGALWSSSEDESSVSPPALPFSAPDATPLDDHKTGTIWEWDVSRDFNNPALNHDNCHVAFPKLYYQIDQAASYWESARHTISEDDVSIDWCTHGCMRLLIYENELRIIETKDIDHYEDQHDTRRAIAVLAQIHQALLGASANGDILPSIEFAISVRDYISLPDDPADTHSIWSFDRKKDLARDDRLWLMPDFTFWSWERVSNSYSDARRRAISHDAPVADKIPKIVWRGDAKLSRLRTGYLNVTDGKPWADNADDWINIDDFCSYLFNVYIEGMAWSGRLKYLLACDSVAVIHELLYITSYYHLLVPSGPEQNHVSVDRSWSNLETKINYSLDHPEDTQRIIRNSVATFRDRYTTPAAQACYWRELIRGYAQVAFEPEPFEEVDATGSARDYVRKKETSKHLRGIAYELWLTMDHRKPPRPRQEPAQQEQPDLVQTPQYGVPAGPLRDDEEAEAESSQQWSSDPLANPLSVP